jgi:hypothetical protein
MIPHPVHILGVMSPVVSHVGRHWEERLGGKIRAMVLELGHQ